MQKLILCLSLAAIIAGCKKEKKPAPVPEAVITDHTAPVIVLKGNPHDTIALEEIYNDPGATASDDTDGDISASITISGQVYNGFAQNYTRTYTAKDAAGNTAETTRMVTVKSSVDYLAGSYVVDCLPHGGSVTYTYAAQVTVSQTQDHAFTVSRVSELISYSGTGPFTFRIYPVETVGRNSFPVGYMSDVYSTINGELSVAGTTFTLYTASQMGTMPSDLHKGIHIFTKQ